ncbi:YdeI/OmpD-associated family protein [Terriglobus tenax]|uniref:YdeI/OmpD-associated family protein n=1 Tax=Terriglobus tenax TaxID=1111115 RepID=UPI0021E0ECDD|nr:YdeI/OmpD-associated family protein [Terriglobus tenax]
MATAKNKPRSFKATLEHLQGNLGWVVVYLPFDPAKAWSERRRLRVRGDVNGFAFRSSLFPKTGGGGFFLLVNKTMQKGAKATVGSVVTVTMEPDLEERDFGVPASLAPYLKKDRALKKFYDEFSDSTKHDIARTFAEVKSPETLKKRTEQMVERMMLAMEGERDTPPILLMLFRENPMAEKGWKQMTPVQRRGHLLGIFYYQTPESREKRARKVVDEALKVAEKKG